MRYRTFGRIPIKSKYGRQSITNRLNMHNKQFSAEYIKAFLKLNFKELKSQQQNRKIKNDGSGVKLGVSFQNVM